MQIISSEHIDFVKWDACVQNNENGLIYATSTYLNAMTDNWSGLLINDYQAIMPLPWRKKWGIRYLYTPAFTQQLGLIGQTNVSAIELQKKVLQFARFGNYLFNDGNAPLGDELSFFECNNYIIYLNKSYEEIRSSYKKNFKKNTNKPIHNELNYQKSDEYELAIRSFYQYNSAHILHVHSAEIDCFIKLCSQLFPANILVRKVTNKADELLSIVLLLKDNKRYYNLINYTSAAGRKVEANYFLYDNLFKELAENDLLFDFEGSDLPGVKSFYECMGGLNKPYYLWQFNHLPWPLHLFKK